MFGIERAQKVTLCKRRLSISPLFRISAFKCTAKSLTRGEIRSALQGIQPKIGSGLLLTFVVLQDLYGCPLLGYQTFQSFQSLLYLFLQSVRRLY